MKKILPLVLIFAATGLLSVQWMWSEDETAVQKRQFSERVNLALRQSGHQLMTLNGDTKSTIPPVGQLTENEFTLRLDHPFRYDTLPYLLSAAFADYDIPSDYQVALKNCETDTLIWGYNLLAVRKRDIACLDREPTTECGIISVVFEKKPEAFSSKPVLAIGMGVLGLLLAVQMFFFPKKARETVEEAAPVNSDVIKIGNTLFDQKNQTVTVNSRQKSLTYRESKLLHFFASQPSQVLEREKILSEVWEDEGVIVGRSLDVFVSRLRKILKDDKTLKISNVHGVGYRLEVLA